MTESNVTYIDMPDTNEFLVRVWVPTPTLRMVSGFKVERTVLREGTTARHDLRAAAESPQWLAKYFAVFVPKVEGIYNVTGWGATDPNTGEVFRPQSMQLKVTGNGSEASIEKIGYGDALEAFGVARSTSGGQRQGAMVQASA